MHVISQRLFDAGGHPPQRHLPQRREIAGTEEVLEGLLRPLRWVDLSLVKPLDQRLGRQVDELDVGIVENLVGNRLPDLDAGNPGDDVLQAGEVLNVERRDDVDPGVTQQLDVLVALVVRRARSVRVRQLVDQDDLRVASQDRVGIHLLDDHPAIGNLLAGNDFQIADLRFCLRPAMRLDEADDDILPLGPQPLGLIEHGVGLADPGRGAKKDPQPAPPATLLRALEVIALEELFRRWPPWLGHGSVVSQFRPPRTRWVTASGIEESHPL